MSNLRITNSLDERGTQSDVTHRAITPDRRRHAMTKTKPVKARKAEASPVLPKPTPDRSSKQDKLIKLMRRPAGATLADLVKATGWQPHTIRGAISGSLRKRLGLTVTAERSDKGKSVYRITG
jgi:hypothetical protein